MRKTKKTPRARKPSPKPVPPRYAALKKIALAFPGAEEVWFHGDPWFNVGSKSFALYSSSAGKWIFKLPKPQQMMLFDARPETFTPMRAGLMVWSFVVVENLDSAELKDLLTAAWKTIVTKKVQMLYDYDPWGRR
jgi:hypothetical protein